MSRDIICTQCPNIYDEDEIVAERPGAEPTTLRKVLGSDAVADPMDASSKTGLFRRLRALGEPPPKQASPLDRSVAARQKEAIENLDRLRDWTFHCPHDHPVEGNRGRQLPLAVVGPSGSSKSHFLPGLIWEADVLQALRPWKVTLREGQFTAAGLNAAAAAVYRTGKQLPPTPPTEVIGPFGYRLSTDSSGRSDDYLLVLYDVGGEALSQITRIRDQAPFVLLSQAICVLLDPEHLLPTEFDPEDRVPSERDRRIAAADARRGIGRVADALEEMWGERMRDIPIPACFVIAKADCINWPLTYESETEQVAKDTANGSLHDALVASSKRVMEAFRLEGGGPIIDDVLERFNGDQVRFVAASATSQMPLNPPRDDDVVWDEPEPNGIALALLHVLEMLGTFPKQGSSATTVGSAEQ